MKIAALDGYAANPGDLLWEPLKQFGELEIYDRTPAELVVERAKDADAILTNKVKIDETVLSQLPRLRYIGVLATGYNIVDVEAAARREIVVTNIPAYSTDSVVQMTFAHILNIANRVEHYASQNRQGRWSRNPDFCYWDTPLTELSGKTLGIVGLGNIGKSVARIAREFGMNVFAYTSKALSDLPEGIRKTTLDGLFGISDVVSLHCPLTPQTRHLINAETLAKMKQGSILINTGRGPLVDEQAVADALSTGHLLAYGADVMAEEPPASDNPLLQQPNAFITPHIAWATREARQRLMDICTENLRAFIDGKPQNDVTGRSR